MNTQAINIPIENISITGLNDRKTHSIDGHQELTESIKSHGILQQLIVRKNGKENHYELVAGERRLLAAKAAGLIEVPCNVKDLSDSEFKEIMLIENLQRENIHPLDEAQSFYRLINEEKIPINELANKVGKSTTFINTRLSLLQLCELGVELFRDNKISLGHAQILALFTHEQQSKAINSIAKGDEGFNYFNHPYELKNWINNRILKRLDAAIFDTEEDKLIKGVGPCSSCPKQTGHNAELFSCLTKDAQCMDSECFDLKTETFIDRHNQAIADKFNVNLEEARILSNSHYPSYQEVGKDKWVEVKSADECVHTTVGLTRENYNKPLLAVMACLNPKCSVHFNQDINASTSSIPEDETASESFERRMHKRHHKQLIEDTHAARLDLLNAARAADNSQLVTYELLHVIQIMINRCGSSIAKDYAIELGFEVEGHSWYWSTDFMDFLKKQDYFTIVKYLRGLILNENLAAGDKFITTRNLKEDKLINHGKELGVSYAPLLKLHKENRKESHKADRAELKKIKDKEAERSAKIQSVIDSAQTDYPELFKVLMSKNKRKALEKLTVDELSKMAFRLGLKRKKDGDITYYVITISSGLEKLDTN